MNERTAGVFDNIIDFVKHHRWAIVGIMIAVFAGVGINGCAVTGPNPSGPGGAPVTGEQLEQIVLGQQQTFADRATMLDAQGKQLDTEIASFNERASASVDVIVEKEEARAALIEGVGGLVTSIAAGGFNPVTGISSILNLLLLGGAAGMFGDRLRGSRRIRELKARLNGDEFVGDGDLGPSP